MPDITTRIITASTSKNSKPPGLFEQAEKIGISKKVVIYSGIFMVAVFFFLITSILHQRSKPQNNPPSTNYPIRRPYYTPSATSYWYDILPGDTLEGIALSHGYVDTPDATAWQQILSVGGNSQAITADAKQHGQTSDYQNYLFPGER